MTALRGEPRDQSPPGGAGPGGCAGPGGGGAAPGERPRAGSRPLTAIEELDSYLEDPGEPSLVQLETRVQGHLDQAALELALADVLAADPGARRRLAASPPWRRHLRWETPPSPEPGRAAAAGEAARLTVVRWRGDAELAAVRESLSGRPISLRHGVLRLILAIGPDSDAVILQTHHAAFDGISCVALLAAICAAYQDRAAVRPSARPEDAPAARPAGLRPPAGLMAGSAGPVAAADSRTPRVPGAVARIARRSGTPGAAGHGVVQWTAPVPRRADRDGHPRPTVNDLLVTSLVLAVHRWNAAQARPAVTLAERPERSSSARQRGGRISVAVPVNVRDPRKRWTGPGNQTRLIRVSARPGDCAEPAALLASVAAQIQLARQRPRPGLDGAARLLGTGWAPAGLKRGAVRLARRLAGPLVTDTALVSNLGVLPAAPSFSGSGTEPLWFCGPAPMPRGLGLGAVTVAGRLHLCLVYHFALFDAAAAGEFTDLYRDALAELTAEPA